MCGTPAIVNGKCDVLNTHIQKSRAGFAYSSFSEFSDALLRIINDKELYAELNRNGRKYYQENYSIEFYKNTLISVFENGQYLND